MPQAPVNGIELYYESHGEGPAIVFAHGRGGNHMSWWQQVPAFREEYRCITFDHRGWGASSDSANPRGRSAFVEDLGGLLDHLGVDRTFLVAQSMGGLTCLGFALAHPQRVMGLVLGDTTGGVGDPAVMEAIRDVNPPAGGLGRTLSAGFIDQHPDMAFLYQQIEGLNPELPVNEISPAFRDPSGPQAADLAGFKVPTLLIVGEEDLIFPPKVIRATHELIPGSRLEVVPGAAHSTHLEKPQVFNRLINEFLVQVNAASPAAATAD